VNRFKRWVYATALRLTLPLVHRILCVSEATRRDLLQECPPAADRARTVYNGIDANVFDPHANRENVRKEYACINGPVLLTVARLTEPKGHRYLLETLPSLMKEWPTLTCLFVGDGECRASLQALAQRLGIGQACRFVGAKDNLADFYATADVVVLPSLSEGFPFAVLEALAMSRPMVATRVNGVPEIIEDGVTGLLVPSRDTQALEVAIRRILRDPAWAAQMGQAGRTLVTARFTVDQMLKETIAVLEGDMVAISHVTTALKRDAA
jgi:glycosyltransferase involved in cell wall biosynthesis